MKIIQRPSPNFGPRKGGVAPDMIIIHYTGMTGTDTALDRLCDPGPEVSAHYLISETGQCYQLVEEAWRAWHAGVGSWDGCMDINSQSIGIELANPGPLLDFPPFPEPQILALETLIADIRSRWVIPSGRILGHADVSPGRKIDPGPKFDWARLRKTAGD